MNYLDKRTIEKFEIIKPWTVRNQPCAPSRYKQLVDAAVKAKRSKTHRHLDTEYSLEEQKLMDILMHSIAKDTCGSDCPSAAAPT